MSTKNNQSMGSGGGKLKEKHNRNDEKLSTVQDHDDTTCVVCFTTVKMFSIGECDHPVCYVCSTRMRVLCKRNECPICRRDISQVIFTTDKLPFRELEIKYRSGLYDKKYRIRFATSKGQADFHKLLENRCPKCTEEPFVTFEQLRDHVRKEHEMFYCDLCTENLKIFSSERKCYTRTELGIHRRKGDIDNKSHRGHPLCKYCDCRFVDKDELFRHMRREHYLCHLCDADGHNEFYANLLAMREHFRQDHYLCEEGDCVQENFTSVFRTDIDLRAHIATVHGRTMSKFANKQTRTLELEFTLAPRSRQQAIDNNGNSNTMNGSKFSSRSRQQPSSIDNQNDFDEEDEEITFQTPVPIIDARNEQEFPSLSGATNAGTSIFTMQPHVSIRTKVYGASGLARTKENFPALGKNNNNNSESNQMSYKHGMASALLKGNNTASSSVKSSTVSNVSGAGTSSEVLIHVSNRPTKPTTSKNNLRTTNSKEFPSLPGTTLTRNHNQNKKSDLETDFISPASSAFALSAIAAKHRQLVDGYESVGQIDNQNAKVALIQKQTTQTSVTQKKTVEKVPKLNSNDSFPVLSGFNNLITGQTKSTTPTWMTTSKQSQQRKPMTAPSTMQHSASNYNDNTNNTKSVKQQQISKKQDTTIAISGKPTSAKIINLNQQNVNVGKKEKMVQLPIKKDINDTAIQKKQQKKQRNIKTEYDENDDEPLSNFDLSNLKHAVSAKHRGMLINYESHNAKFDTKIKINTDAISANNNNSGDKKCPIKNESKVPKINSLGLFPSLSKQKPMESNNNNNSTKINNKNIKNFSEIIKTDLFKQSDVDTETIVTNDANSLNLNSVTEENIQELNKTTSSGGPPPGFGGKNKVPPGFSSNNNQITLNSVAKPLTDLTFTTSLGESFSILPSYTYIPPPSAIQRNQELVTHFHSILKESDVVEQFKQISQNFMTGSYFAQTYYEHCLIALNDKFDAIFPELLALLPDIGKQQELYLVHSQYQQQQQQLNNKNKMLDNNNCQVAALEVCTVCKQVLITLDVDAHTQMHVLENNFPTLKSYTSGSNTMVTNSDQI